MPVYTTPNFNIALDMWLPPAVPSTSPPTFTAVVCQLYVYSRTPQLMLHPGSGRWLPVIIIRLPFSFPVTVPADAIFRYQGSLPQGPHFAKVQYVQLLHAGFTNQYYSLYCLQCNNNGSIPKVPLPT